MYIYFIDAKDGCDLLTADFDFNPVGVEITNGLATYKVDKLVYDTQCNRLEGHCSEVMASLEGFEPPIEFVTANIIPNQQQLTEILDYVDRGAKLQAVKYVFDTFKVGLKEAKDYIDMVCREPF